MNLFFFDKQNLDEVVFEKRNKAYGAYALRKAYPARLNKSILITLLPLLVLLIATLVKHPIKELPRLFPDNTSGSKPPITKDKFDERIELVSGFEIIIDPVNFKVVPDKSLKEKPKQKVKVKQLVTAAIAGINASASSSGPSIGGIGLPGLGVAGGGLPVFSQGGSDEIMDAASVGVMAEFPGGLEAMYAYIGKHLNYPSLARENAKEGKVVLSFIINKSGKVQQIEVERGIGFGCDDEAVRVIESMPNWTPATQNGKEVAVRMVLPIVFRLQ